MKLYPVLLNLEGRTATIVGGGEVALRKVRDLLDAGASVRIVSPEIHDEINSLKERYPGRLDIRNKPYTRGDLHGSFLAYTTSDNAEVNRIAAAEAESLRIPVNITDDPEASTFFVPSFIRQGDFLLAVSTGGASPAMAARLRRLLQEHIPADMEDRLDALSHARDILKIETEFAKLTSPGRGDVLRRLVNDDELLAQLVKADKDESLVEFLRKQVE